MRLLRRRPTNPPAPADRIPLDAGAGPNTTESDHAVAVALALNALYTAIGSDRHPCHISAVIWDAMNEHTYGLHAVVNWRGAARHIITELAPPSTQKERTP